MSASLQTYETSARRAQDLCALALEQRSRSSERRQTLYHASLAAHVATWQTYIQALCAEAVSSMRLPPPVDGRFVHIHAMQAGWLEIEAKRFNTPTWDNCRNLVFRATGFDPLSSWTWPARRRSSQWVKVRWAEILKVRHAFAHGHPIPPCAWTQNASGHVRLTKDGVTTANRMFINLARRTDSDLGQFLTNLFGHLPNW